MSSSDSAPASSAVPVLDLTASTPSITQQLCDIESVSGDEAAIADAVWLALSALPHLTLTRHGNSVIARTDLGRDRRVAIAGHLDTVPINNNLPTRWIEEDGEEVLWGRGTVDMKGGCAVQLKLAAELTDPVVDLTWIWYENEEVSGELNGLRLISVDHPELLAADFAILGEPTGAQVEGGCNGTLRAEIRSFGKRAHSARAWKGVNAIHGILPVLQTLADYEPGEVEVDGLVYREGLNAVGITGGIAGNVIPDECMVHINYRFAPSRSVEQAIARIEELFEGFEVTIVDANPGARPGLDDPLAIEFVKAVGVEAKPKYGWTDVARFSALGIPAVNYGPGDPSLAHADDERVPAWQITSVEEGLRSWLSAR